jgi:hypothetical protein
MLDRGKAFAGRLEREEGDESRRIVLAYRLAFGRGATANETAAALAFLDEQAKRIDPARSDSPQAAFAGGRIPRRDSQAADFTLAAGGFQIAGDKLPSGDFTLETVIYMRSVAENSELRTIASHWDGNLKTPGWNFGITGRQSRRKPRTVALQLVGTKRDGSFGEEAIFSDQPLALNKPYYVAAAVKLATESSPGEVTFSLKDLANDDEPLLTDKVKHSMTGGLANKLPMTLGCRSAKGEARFDGMLDDVRLSSAALGVDELLYTRDGTNAHTVGYWQFEPKPGVFQDSAGHGLELKPIGAIAIKPRSPRQIAWADFCHVLLNASEFLYVE